MKKNTVFILAAVVFTVLAAAYIFNFYLVTTFSGYSFAKKSIYTEGIDSQGRSFRIVGDSAELENQKLGLFTKNQLGVWSLTKETKKTEQTPYLVLEALNSRRKPGTDSGANMILESRQVIAGCNATRQISFSDRLPQGYTAEVRQNGRNYVVVLIHYYGQGAEMSESIEEFLQDFTEE